MANYHHEFKKYPNKGRKHQSTRHGQHGRPVMIILPPELQGVIEDLAEEEEFAISLTIVTLLAIQLGVKLHETKGDFRQGAARIIPNAQKRRNNRPKGSSLRLVSAM